VPQTNLTSMRCDPPAPGEPQWTEEQHLACLLASADIRCPRCGLNLRGQAGSRCPQCRSELMLSLSPAQPVLGAWITMMIPLCLSAGLGIFFAAAIFSSGWPDNSLQREWQWYPLSASLVYHLLSIPLALAGLLGQRRFMRLPGKTQKCLAGAAVLSFLVGSGLFVVAVVVG